MSRSSDEIHSPLLGEALLITDAPKRLTREGFDVIYAILKADGVENPQLAVKQDFEALKASAQDPDSVDSIMRVFRRNTPASRVRSLDNIAARTGKQEELEKVYAHMAETLNYEQPIDPRLTPDEHEIVSFLSGLSKLAQEKGYIKSTLSDAPRDSGWRQRMTQATSESKLVADLQKMTESFPDLPYPYTINNIHSVPFGLESKARSWPDSVDHPAKPQADRFLETFGVNPMELAVIVGKAEGMTEALRTDFGQPDSKQWQALPLLKSAEKLSSDIRQLNDAAAPYIASFPEPVQAEYSRIKAEAAKSTMDNLSLDADRRYFENLPSFPMQVAKAIMRDISDGLKGK